MLPGVDLLRLAAFPDGDRGGNPAGVVLDAGGLTAAEMQRIAAAVGYAETAFVTATDGHVVRVRYFSPVADVPFCGHATIATAVALAAAGRGRALVFATPAGSFPVRVDDRGGEPVAAFTSADPRVEQLPAAVLDRLLALLGLGRGDLDPRCPARIVDAGNAHPVVVLAEADRFDAFGFDAAALRALMVEQGWVATVTVLRLVDDSTVDARNLFPVGTLDEDPATGSAAAATGAYLRAIGRIAPPARLVVLQGRHVGTPCRLEVTVPASGPMEVAGTARRLD